MSKTAFCYQLENSSHLSEFLPKMQYLGAMSLTPLGCSLKTQVFRYVPENFSTCGNLWHSCTTEADA